MPKPIFVGGCPRSGTTLVRNIIASHPDVSEVTARDFHFPCSEETLEGWLFHRGLSNREIAIRWQTATAKHSQRYCVEKTPGNAFCFSRIKKVFPDAVLVRVVRNKADTVQSIVRAAAWVKSLPATQIQAEMLYDSYNNVEAGIVAYFDMVRWSHIARNILYDQIGLPQYEGRVSNPEGVPGSRGENFSDTL